MIPLDANDYCGLFVHNKMFCRNGPKRNFTTSARIVLQNGTAEAVEQCVDFSKSYYPAVDQSCKKNPKKNAGLQPTGIYLCCKN